MSDILKVKPVPLPDNIKQELLDFEILRENWNTYELEDGSIIKSKFILSQLIKSEKTAPQDDDLNLGFMEPRNITTVFAPIEKRGKPDRNYSVSELEKFVINKECKIKKQTRTDPTIYKTEKMLIFVHSILNKIEKTSKYSSAGMPLYIIRSSNQIIISSIPPLEDLEKKPVLKK